MFRDSNTKSYIHGRIDTEKPSFPFECSQREYEQVDLPRTRYYGSKRRFSEQIQSAVSGLSFDTVLDPFGGTGTVSLLFKSMGKHVTYNDVLSFNYHVARALLNADKSGFCPRSISEFFASVVPEHGFISSTFPSIYYTDFENNWLDGAVRKIARVRRVQFASELYYCLFQACLQKRPYNLFHRKNLYMRLNCSRDTKFGNWATWDRSFEELIARASLELLKAQSVAIGRAKVLKPKDAMSIRPGYDLVYVDPPYIDQNNNDLDYLQRYHFLEGLCQPKSWSSYIDLNSANRRFLSNKTISDWNSKVHFRDLLFSFIEKHSNSIVVLSYQSPGIPSCEEITRLFHQIFKHVRVVKVSAHHALRKSQKQELIFVGSRQ